MAKMKAVSYYYAPMSERSYSGIKFHKTGKDALKCIKEDSKGIFGKTIIWKNKNISVTRKSPVSIGFPFRKLVARFLDEEEVALVEKYGEDVWWNYEEGRVIAPQEENDDSA